MRETYMCAAGLAASFAVLLTIMFPSVPQLLFSVLVSATAVAGKLAGIY